MNTPVPDASEPLSLPEQVTDFVASAKAYAVQETIGPLKGVSRFLAFGIGGALLGGIGVVLLALAGLRALQTETGSSMTGHLSWIPYLIVCAVVLALLALVLSRIGRHDLARPKGSR